MVNVQLIAAEYLMVITVGDHFSFLSLGFQIPLTDHGKKCENHGWLRVNISLIKSVNDYAHHTTPPVTYMIPQVPQHQTHTVHIQPPLGCSNCVPHPPVYHNSLLSERPDLLRRGSYHRFHYPSSNTYGKLLLLFLICRFESSKSWKYLSATLSCTS